MPALSSPTICEPAAAPSFPEAAPEFVPPAAGDEARLVSDPASGRRFLLIPLPDGGSGAGNSDHLAATASLIQRQEQEREQLEQERDALADHIGQNFEELHWLRLLATVVSASHPTDEIQTVANGVLPDLAELIRAESVVFVPEEESDEVRSEQTVTAGHPVVRDELEGLLEDLRRLSPDGPFVFNRESRLQMSRPRIAARNVVAIPVIQNQTRYGWLIALNRVKLPRVDGQLETDVSSADFGTSEVGLLTTAASMLGGHTRNVELFRAEESLRVSVIETITEALDARDQNTCGHSRRVGQYAARIAERFGYTADACERIYITGLLHDVGKIGIPDDILKKPDRLTDEEFEVIKQHPEIGHSILSPLKGLAYVLPGVLHHHERIDGRGYPHGLAGDAIPLDARILAVADAFDAMTGNRTYRDGMEPSKAIEILRAGAGQHWDADAVSAFIAIRQATVE